MATSPDPTRRPRDLTLGGRSLGDATSASPTPETRSAYSPTLKATDQPSMKPSGAIPPEVRDALPSAHFGKFIRVQKIGQGGMGEVWKAWDCELNRWVALKFLLGGDQDEIDRFKREAQMAGALNHPNIAAIYEVGQAQDRHYIAMQFVAGQTLKTFPRGNRKTLVSQIRDAALAVQFAHEQGIVHRDIKPENLMVVSRMKPGTGRTPKGKPIESHHVYVMDFGLARATEGASNLSVSGSIVGTPAYMSPEQSRGEKVDARADVYSLGASLYELLTDRKPFQGKNVYDTLRKVQEEEPKRPRLVDRRLDEDSETIVLKCIEKDRRRRYESAAALAEDLGRWLDGDAIAARPSSMAYRARKALARRKVAVFSTLAGISVAALIIVPLLLKKQSDLDLARTEAELERRQTAKTGQRLTSVQQRLLMQMRETTDACLDAALVRRRVGDIPGMLKYEPKVRAICDEVTKEMPTLAEPHYRLGRMHRALMRDEEALLEQNRALGKEGDYAPALYERVVLNHRRYFLRLRKLLEDAQAEEGARLANQSGGRVRAGTARVERPIAELASNDDAAVSIRKVVTEDAGRLDAHGDGVLIDRVQVLCARALREDVLGRSEVRAQLLVDVTRSDSAPEEAFEALAEHCYSQGAIAEAIKWLTTGLERDRGYVPYLERRAGMYVMLAAQAFQRGQEYESHYQAALVDCEEATRLMPGRMESRMMRGTALHNWALDLHATGRGPEQRYRDAAASFGEALETDLCNAEAWLGRGNARSGLGLARADSGEDPTEVYEAAIADYSKAIELLPRNHKPYRSRGHTFNNLGWFQYAHGKDPGPSYARSLDDLDSSLKLHPGDEQAWADRATTAINWANYMLDAGGDVTELCRQAMADCDEAIKINPQRDEHWMWRGLSGNNLGFYVAQHGGDPAVIYSRAVDDLTRALNLLPGRNETWTWRALTFLNWASYESKQGRSPIEQLRKAVDDATSSLKLNASFARTWQLRADARCSLGLHLLNLGEDATDQLKGADSDYKQLLQQEPANASNWKNRGEVNYGLALLRLKRREQARTEFQVARDCFEKAVKLDNRILADVKPRLNTCRQFLGSPK